jgi:hypothetical protein
MALISINFQSNIYVNLTYVKNVYNYILKFELFTYNIYSYLRVQALINYVKIKKKRSTKLLFNL